MGGDWMIVHEIRWATMAPYLDAVGQETGFFGPWSIDEFLGASSWETPPVEITFVGDTDELPAGQSPGVPFTSVLAPGSVRKRHDPDAFPYASDIWMSEWTSRRQIRVTQLTDNGEGLFDADPVLSPTGELVAFFRSDREGHERIMTVRPDGSDVREVARGFDPQWSPDGSQIVYVREPEGCHTPGGCSTRIAVVNSDGTGDHVIAEGGKPDWGPGCTIAGTSGDDMLTGTDGRDFICAGGGHDRVLGGDGNDTIFGGRGRDFLLGDAGDDTLMGDAGADRLLGGAGRDAIGAADLVLGNDTTSGGDDVDICFVDTKFYRFPRVCEVVRSISD
jgi:hypothetical protein